MDELAEPWTDRASRRTSVRAMILAALVVLSSTGQAFAQAAALTITKSFNPSTVAVGGDSILTVTVSNPNAFPVSAVQFSDTMPAGIDLITQTGGDCSTLATGGGMFSINPGAETFSSTSNVLGARPILLSHVAGPANRGRPAPQHDVASHRHRSSPWWPCDGNPEWRGAGVDSGAGPLGTGRPHRPSRLTGDPTAPPAGSCLMESCRSRS